MKQDHELRRREWLWYLGVAGLSLPRRGLGQAATPGLIIRERDPANLEFPFASLDSFVTPNERFYVRSHFAVPKLDAATYRLRVEGAVERPFDISYDDLRKLPQSSVMATLECAGNSRVFLVPQTGGAQWELGAVSNAEWTGVRLATLLERAGVKTGAVEVLLEGADRGEPRNDPRPPGGTSYLRSISVQKAMRPETLLAHTMNGKELPASHGFPLRAVVPGYYGMSSVKWINRIIVLPEQYQGYWQTTDYAYWDRSSGTPVRRPLMDMTIKSLIARPSLNEVVKQGTSYQVTGAAWSGDADVTRVEVSTDRGKTWSDARFLDTATRFAWRRWSFDWRVPNSSGSATLLSRATDSKGNIQPEQHNRDTGNYVIHHVLPVDILIS